MNISTRLFGNVEIDESKIITFDEEIPGFAGLKRYLFMLNDETGPFYWLQSIDDTDIVFPIIDVLAYLPNYDPLITVDDLASLGKCENPENIMVYNIVVIPEKIEDISVNLKAPVVINLETLKAKQIISSNEEYKIKYYIHKELESMKAGE